MNCANPNQGWTEPTQIWTLNDATFDQVVVPGRNVVVEFYAPWCKACVIFEPKYKAAVQEALQRGQDVIFAKGLFINHVVKKREGKRKKMVRNRCSKIGRRKSKSV